MYPLYSDLRQMIFELFEQFETDVGVGDVIEKQISLLVIGS